MLTAALIKRFTPSARADIVAGLVDGWPRIYAAGINKPNRLQHFMAEMAVESAGFTTLEENLSYSAKRMMQVWPSHFPSLSVALACEHNPKALADRCYGGRMGNLKPGDGFEFRGSGMIQLTGRANFAAAGFADKPDDLRHMPGALDAALSFWSKRNLNAIVDKGDLRAERMAINGGLNGFSDLEIYLHHAATIFTQIVPPGAPVTVEPAGTHIPVAAIATPPASSESAMSWFAKWLSSH